VNERFADTFYFLALFSAADEAHERAVQLNRERRGVLVTTAWVLTEVADALAAPQSRSVFLRLLAALRGDPRAVVVSADTELFDRGVTLYTCRADKFWTLTDCISFIVMEDRGIRDALTGDHHFEQAGFTILF
jgi:predicted nucleic acid-binding protein